MRRLEIRDPLKVGMPCRYDIPFSTAHPIPGQRRHYKEQILLRMPTTKHGKRCGLKPVDKLRILWAPRPLDMLTATGTPIIQSSPNSPSLRKALDDLKAMGIHTPPSLVPPTEGPGSQYMGGSDELIESIVRKIRILSKKRINDKPIVIRILGSMLSGKTSFSRQLFARLQGEKESLKKEVLSLSADFHLLPREVRYKEHKTDTWTCMSPSFKRAVLATGSGEEVEVPEYSLLTGEVSKTTLVPTKGKIVIWEGIQTSIIPSDITVYVYAPDPVRLERTYRDIPKRVLEHKDVTDLHVRHLISEIDAQNREKPMEFSDLEAQVLAALEQSDETKFHKKEILQTAKDAAITYLRRQQFIHPADCFDHHVRALTQQVRQMHDSTKVRLALGGSEETNYVLNTATNSAYKIGTNEKKPVRRRLVFT